ncbi:Vinorine synthase [Arachis hypogaea]|uniref:Vinorine synthase n=2 Tax=Arachis TaxID=3817 RepID=A0A6B9V4U5_ARAHY|nr:Vinorine synthase [Arachis hypogaea]
MCNLHTLLDASSCITFLKTWFAISRGSTEEISFPDFSSAPSLFPPRVNTSGLMRSGVLNLGRNIEIETLCTTRRFLFDFKAMNELISKAALGNNGRMMNTNPTRYQAVSSFICKHMIMSCTKEEQDKNRPVVVLHVVDMRRRMGEPFTQNSIGNLLWPAVMLCENVKKDTEISELVKVSKGGIGKVTKELLVRVQKDEGFWWSDECGKLMLEEVVNKDPVSFLFTSWCDMGFKELDFGLGKPLWLAQKGGNSETIPNTVVFMDTKDGMEAWISMRPQHIATLENDVDFLKFALLNPSVSILLK